MKTILAVALLTLLAGCTGLTGPRADFSIYALNPPVSRSAADAPVHWQLLVEVPHASDLHDSARIVVAPHGNERQVYKGARWVERVPSLLQGIWVRAFEADGRLPGVARAGSGVRADLILSTDLVDFQATHVQTAPRIEVEVHARLIDPRSRRIVARRVLRTEQPAADASVAAAVDAFDAALAQINPILIDWTLTEGERAMRPGSGNEDADAVSARQ